MHGDEVDVGRGRTARATAASSRARHDVDDLAALGRREHRGDDTRAEAAPDDADRGRVIVAPLTPPPSPCRVGVDATDAEVQAGEEPVPDRADAEREQHRADADVAAEREPDDEREQLDHGAHEPERVAARGDRGHQPVARPGPRPAPMYSAMPERGDDDAAEQHRPPHREVVARREARRASRRR